MLDKSRCNKMIKDCNELYAIAEETFSLESLYVEGIKNRGYINTSVFVSTIELNFNMRKFIFRTQILSNTQA